MALPSTTCGTSAGRKEPMDEWSASLKAIARATSYEHYLQLCVEEAQAEVVEEATRIVLDEVQ